MKHRTLFSDKWSVNAKYVGVDSPWDIAWTLKEVGPGTGVGYVLMIPCEGSNEPWRKICEEVEKKCP